MAIYRIHKEDNYVIVDKAFLLNEKISLKAKGLLALLLSCLLYTSPGHYDGA